jgi:hypothetical protein
MATIDLGYSTLDDGFKKKPCNLGVKTAVFPWFKNGIFGVKSCPVLTSGPF